MNSAIDIWKVEMSGFSPKRSTEPILLLRMNSSMLDIVGTVRGS